MKKVLYFGIVFTLLMALLLTGCGGQDADNDANNNVANNSANDDMANDDMNNDDMADDDMNNDETSDDAADDDEMDMEPVTIQFWHVWGGARLEMIDAMIADFNELYPHITVEHTLLDQADMVEKYLTAITSGSPPDVIMVHGANFFQSFASQGALMSLDDYIAADGMVLTDIFYEPDVETYQWEGSTYGLPLASGAGMYIFHIDVDAFTAAGLDPESPPTTWQELKDYAEQLTVKDGDTYTQIGFSPYGFTNYPFKEWLYLNNGRLFSEDGKTVAFNSPEGLETLTWMVGFYDDLYGGFENVLDLAGAGTSSGYNERDTWYNGGVAMHVDGVWHNAQLTASAPEKNVAAFVMPYNGDNPDATVRNIVEGGWTYSIPTGSANPDAAWLFLKYATAGEGNHSFFMAQGRPTPVKEWNADPDMATGNPYWDAYIANMEASEKSPVNPAMGEINEIITLMTEEALLKVKTPEEALNDAAQAIQEILDDL